MARAGISLLAGGLLFLTGCTNLSHWMKEPEGHATEETAARKQYLKDDEPSHETFTNKDGDKKQDEYDEAELLKGTEENPFSKSRRGPMRNKESDGLTKLLQGLSDPRTAEINRDLGVD